MRRGLIERLPLLGASDVQTEFYFHKIQQKIVSKRKMFEGECVGKDAPARALPLPLTPRAPAATVVDRRSVSSAAPDQPK